MNENLAYQEESGEELLNGKIVMISSPFCDAFCDGVDDGLF